MDMDISDSQLLSDIIINTHIYDVIIQDYYDTTDWVGCLGCRGLMHPTHTCEWCDYISHKDPDAHFKTVRFDVDKYTFRKSIAKVLAYLF